MCRGRSSSFYTRGHHCIEVEVTRERQRDSADGSYFRSIVTIRITQ
jgi:hypothetical protein